MSEVSEVMDEEPTGGRTLAQVQEAQAAMQRGDLAGAKHTLQQALRVANDDASLERCWVLKAELHEAESAVHDAIIAWRTALGFNATAHVYRVRLAGLLVATKAHDQALPVLNEILDDDPFHPEATILRARIALADEDRETAVRLLCQALTIQPKHDELLAETVWLGFSLGSQGDAASIPAIDAVLQHHPDNESYLEAGLAIFKSFGDDERFVRWYPRLEKINPKLTSPALYDLAKAQWRKGAFEASCESLDRASTEGGKTVQYCRWQTTRDYCAEQGLRYETLPTPETTRSHLAHIHGEARNLTHVDTMHPEWYLAALRDVRVLGCVSEVFTADGRGLNDIISHPRASRFDFRSPAYAFHDMQGAAVVFDRDGGQVIDKGILFCGGASWNFTHFLLEFLPRFYILNQFPEYADYPLILDEAATRDPQFLALIDIYDRFRRPRVAISRAQTVTVRELICPSRLCAFPVHLKEGLPISPWDMSLPQQVVTFLRTALRHPQSYGHRRIAIHRVGGGRKVTNAAEVETVLREFDFEFVRPELMTLDEKLALFGDTSIVFGSGSGLSNIVFSPPHTRGICHLSSAWRPLTLFPTLVEHMGGHHEFIVGEDAEPGLHVSYRVDPEQLRALLAKHVELAEAHLQAQAA